MPRVALQSKENGDVIPKTARRRKSTRSRLAPAPCRWCSVRKDAIVRYKALLQYRAGRAGIDDLVYAGTPDASVRRSKLHKGKCHIVPCRMREREA